VTWAPAFDARGASGGLPFGHGHCLLRIRLAGGDHTDLTYDDPEQENEVELLDQVARC